MNNIDFVFIFKRVKLEFIVTSFTNANCNFPRCLPSVS